MGGSSNLHAVILCGGGGRRLWPLSRDGHPKQFISLDGGPTLFQETLRRILPAVPPQRMWLVSHRGIDAKAKAQVNSFLGITRKSRGNACPIRTLPEPVGRNTAPAIGLAAVALEHENPDAVMVVLPSDHRIQNHTRFLRLLGHAVKAAENGHLVTFGIRPTHPETGYGYIRTAKLIGAQPDARLFGVERFVEKPDLATARRYLAHGGYYWNSGMFVWKVSVILDEIRRSLPALYDGLCKIRSSWGTSRAMSVLKNVYRRIVPVSIDRGVLERSTRVVLVPADIGWSDVGSWESVYQLSDKDANGNAVSGPGMNIGTRNSMILSAAGRKVALIGVDGVYVIDSGDSVLVCSNRHAQDVRAAAEYLDHPPAQTSRKTRRTRQRRQRKT